MPRTLKLLPLTLSLAAPLCAHAAAHPVRQTPLAAQQVPTKNEASELSKTDFEKREAALAPLKARMRAAADRLVMLAESQPDGLTEAAVEAARAIRFKPATSDGRPVSQLVILEYNFNF